jgi:hypothetical protein
MASDGGGLPIGLMAALFVAVTAAWTVLALVVLRRSRRHRSPADVPLQARPRRRTAEEAGTFVPLSAVARAEQEAWQPPEPALVELEPEPELEPVDLPALPSELGRATTYEVVWYRDEDRLVFALQPVDGRAAGWARYRSTSFAWGEDSDPPASLKAAQSAHGRLRARLVRDGWTPAGRGDTWFGHRFAPPEHAPVPSLDT